MKQRTDNPWRICIIATAILFSTTGMIVTSFITYMPYLIEAGSLTGTEGALIPTVRSISSLAGLFFVSAWHRKIGLRLGLALACLNGALSFLVYAMSGGLTGFLVAAALSGFTYSLGGIVPVSLLLDHAFEKNKALALGISTSGSGIATIIIPPVAAHLIAVRSLRSSLLMESLIFVIVAILALTMIRLPNRTPGSDADTATPQKTPSGATSDKRHSLRHPGAYLLPSGMSPLILPGAFLIGAVTYGTTNNVSNLFITEGMTASFAAALISVYGILLTAGKFIFGRFTDVHGTNNSARLFFPVFIAGILLVCLAPRNPGVAVFSMILYGLGMPLATIGISVFAKKLSCEDTFDLTLARMQTFYTLGTLIIGPFPGIVMDLTGSYIPAFLLLAIAEAVAFFCIRRSISRREAAI